MWSSQQSPSDVRTLVASQMVTDGTGAVFLTDRAKVGGALNDRALAAVEGYVKALGVDLHGDAPIFRNHAARTLADFRRSGTQEAFAGDARPADLSHAMGNAITTSNMLFATYRVVRPALG